MARKFNYKGDRPEILDKSIILIIEDDRVERLMLVQIFTSYGFKNIFEAVNGKDGLEKTQELNPDLVILDMTMPIMDGFQYCEAIRNNPEFNDTTIIVQTGLTDLKRKEQIFEAGATDYITKPIDPHEIGARSFIHLEREFIMKDLKAYKNRVQKELEAAKRLQEVSMPSSKNIASTSKKYNMIINSHFKTSSEMGGDFWGFNELDDHRLSIYNVDFSGHGVDAALNTFRLHTLMNSPHFNSSDPGEYMTQLNKNLVALLPVEQYATMFYGIIDFENDVLLYTSAACPNPIIFYHNSTAPYEVINGRGYPLGAIADVKYETSCVPFKAQDMVILYSDAMIETADKNNKFMEEEKLASMMKKHLNTSKNPCSKIAFKKMLKDFYNKYSDNLKDDLTINAYYRK